MNLTYRQRHLIEYLKEQKGYTKQRQILEDLSLFYDYHGGDLHNSGARRALTQDIREIREEGSHCLFSNSRGVRLGSVDEAIAYHAKRVSTFGSYINKEKAILKNFGLEGQQAYDGAVKEFVEGNG